MILRPRNRPWKDNLQAIGMLLFMGCSSYFVLMIGTHLSAFFDAANRQSFQSLVHSRLFLKSGFLMVVLGYGSLYAFSFARHALRHSKSKLVDDWFPWLRK
jgi:hypothetical protein